MTAQVQAKGKAAENDDQLYRQPIVGARRASNYLWASVVTIGAVGFFLASLSSYTQTNFLAPFSDGTKILFQPNGLVMGLYGSVGILLAIYLWLSVLWNLGGGYNEFNKKTSKLTIFRWGYPGKNRQVSLEAELNDIQAVKVVLQEGINPKRSLYVRVKGMRDIPLTRVGQPISLAQLENQAAALVRFLGVPLEGL
ncbi:photosystem I assembly protein Ycf4 [filamentous cyanobacterium LEGE 11480]|uniref:Photosystem I assembly protein Ycf4 n=1 Tax=Romeriopsis navalis LEGE 11480 TaxID=2777977 RepID=A0A928VR22_9CYAN|nr:photosystem I assembly protein Ycf4 [Romeriopsis navalis]MBE9033096.1 photosystem I assembly protein Ycf4 [Romeriopsis navalis LEGE 11480]